MKALLDRLHAKLGDLWWYSLMIFVACRSGDVIQAFIGLWLVPKYVGTEELGAVLPLLGLSNFLAVPVSVFAMVFMKEVSVLATRGEYGKLKTLLKGVFVTAATALLAALLLSRLILPLFLERIRIAEGSLGILIIATSLVGCVAPIYTNALQALKKFKTLSLLSIIGAPIRLIAMLIAMPFRAISGYFVGQAASPAFSIVASIFTLRKELSTQASPYWSQPTVKRFLQLILAVGIFQAIGNLTALVEQTILRQRLPSLESAAYYMTSRFSEMAGFAALTFMVILFPMTAELAERGRSTKSLVIKSSIATAVFNSILAIFFACFGERILVLLPDGDSYAQFWWAIPWCIAITTMHAVQTIHTNTEISAGRFGFLRWWIPLGIFYPAALLFITGHGYFSGLLPKSTSEFLKAHNVTSLEAILIWFSCFALLKFIFTLHDLKNQN